MKRFYISLFLLAVCLSCDNGNIIVTSFNFEDSQLNLCRVDTRKVLYAVNNQDVNESISLEFTNPNLANDPEEPLFLTTQETVNIQLNSNNRLVYRIYDGEISGSSNSYFCSAIPPSEPRVIEEWFSGTEGVVTVSTNFSDLGADADIDNDGLTNAEEGFSAAGTSSQDSDGDGIEDYLDIDDDNDNVPTRRELTAGEGDPTVGENLDTDGDGTPNYLDPDDDGDGVPTRLEVPANNLTNPDQLVTADGPDYLNANVSTTGVTENNEYLANVINREYRSFVSASNFSFTNQDGSGETINFDDALDLGTYEGQQTTITLCPSIDANCGEETNPDTSNN